MVLKEDYIKDPCGASSLSYYKTNHIIINKKVSKVDNVKSNEKYKYFFKMINYLECEYDICLDDNYMFCDIELNEYVKHINSCYEDIKVTEEEIEKYMNHETYDKDLWIAIKDKKTNDVIGTIIGEFDREIKEGTIEWVEVSKDYKRKGIGYCLVCELLKRLKGKADFVTVSGDYNNQDKPILLYKKSKFEGLVIWKVE